MGEGSEIIDFGKRRRDRLNAHKRASIEVDVEGNFRYPETTSDITEAEALDIAHDIIKKYPDEAALIIDFEERESAYAREHGEQPDSASRANIDTRARIFFTNQREEAAAIATEELKKILEVSKAHPTYYHSGRLRAVADEILKRFQSAE